MPLQAYACSSSMLAPAGDLMTSGLPAALCVSQSEQPGQLNATESLSNTLLQLQLQRQLQQATSAVAAAAAAPLPMGPTPDGCMHTSTTGLGEQGWASRCSTYGTALVSGLAAYPAMGPSHFASPQEDMLQVQMPLTAGYLGSPSPAAVLAMPAMAPALAAAAAGSSDDDISSMDDLTAALDAQLLLLIAKREELLAKRRVSAAFSAGLLM